MVALESCLREGPGMPEPTAGHKEGSSASGVVRGERRVARAVRDRTRPEGATMSANPTKPIKKATKATTRPVTEAASTVKPSRLVKLLPLSWRTKIRLFLARLWAKFKMWRLRRRARNV